MTKYLTYDELMAFALEHYNEGGDSTYECLDRKDFDSDPYYQTMTKAKALKMFKLDDSIRHEYEATAW